MCSAGIGSRTTAVLLKNTTTIGASIELHHHRADDAGAVLGIVKTRATLCLLRLHLRKSRNSEGAIIILSFYPSAPA